MICSETLMAEICLSSFLSMNRRCVCHSFENIVLLFSGMTPLNVVCNRNNPAVARLFIHAGAKVNVADRSNSCPLHYATRNGASKIVKLLLDNGINYIFLYFRSIVLFLMF